MLDINLTYYKLIPLKGTFKGTVHINETNLEKCKIGLLLSDF